MPGSNDQFRPQCKNPRCGDICVCGDEEEKSQPTSSSIDWKTIVSIIIIFAFSGVIVMLSLLLY